ncbi:MAG TPA: hypothetical protein VEL03_21695 [Streptosporangiaceae bacterium]|nr:hypothetical protein [Streptosporangiaceae bacterium]
MRKFSIALSAVGALLMLGAASAAQAAPRIIVGADTHTVHPNATPACGNGCFNLYNLAFGPNEIQSANVPHDNGVGGKVGQTINLRYATDSSPNEDFTGGYAGTVGELCPEGQLSPYICNTYGSSSIYGGNFPVYESNWAPYGNETDLCVGVRRPAYSGENVTLQPCGLSGATFWVADLQNSHIGYTPFLNGADTNYTHPLVLTVVPGWKTGLRLRVERLNLLSHGYIANEQMFALSFGIEL